MLVLHPILLGDRKACRVGGAANPGCRLLSGGASHQYRVPVGPDQRPGVWARPNSPKRKVQPSSQRHPRRQSAQISSPFMTASPPQIQIANRAGANDLRRVVREQRPIYPDAMQFPVTRLAARSEFGALPGGQARAGAFAHDKSLVRIVRPKNAHGFHRSGPSESCTLVRNVSVRSGGLV